MAIDGGSFKVRAGIGAPPRHQTWVDPSARDTERGSASSVEGLADRAALFALAALSVVGTVWIGWFLLVP